MHHNRHKQTEALEQTQKIQMLLCDVDGVFTDGGLFYDSQGRVSKRFHVHDGFGVKLAQSSGLRIGVITGLQSEAVKLRMEELGIQEYHAGYRRKVELLPGICSRNALQEEELAFLGDDWVDASLLVRVGLPMAVANARKEILDLALWVSPHDGGDGAVRDAVSFILAAWGVLEQAWQEWLALE